MCAGRTDQYPSAPTLIRVYMLTDADTECLNFKHTIPTIIDTDYHHLNLSGCYTTQHFSRQFPHEPSSWMRGKYCDRTNTKLKTGVTTCFTTGLFPFFVPIEK